MLTKTISLQSTRGVAYTLPEVDLRKYFTPGTVVVLLDKRSHSVDSTKFLRVNLLTQEHPETGIQQKCPLGKVTYVSKYYCVVEQVGSYREKYKKLNDTYREAYNGVDALRYLRGCA